MNVVCYLNESENLLTKPLHVLVRSFIALVIFFHICSYESALGLCREGVSDFIHTSSERFKTVEKSAFRDLLVTEPSLGTDCKKYRGGCQVGLFDQKPHNVRAKFAFLASHFERRNQNNPRSVIFISRVPSQNLSFVVPKNLFIDEFLRTIVLTI